jgi:hypothetical protein
MGWLYVVKSLVLFAYPPIGLRSLDTVSLEKPWKFAVPGVAMIVLSGLLAYPFL